MLLAEHAGKKYIKEVTRLLNLWTQNTPPRSISLKGIFTIPVLLLQKPSKAAKSKDLLNTLERRLQLWERGESNSLSLEADTNEQKLQ